MNRIILKSFIIFFILTVDTYAHDTTHIHPLITLEIAKLIKSIDAVNGGEKAYGDIYEPNTVSTPGINDAVNFLYWGTDFDPSDKALAESKNIPLVEYFGKDQPDNYISGNDILGYTPNKKTVITGVVYEDFPFTKVLDHFYQANTGAPLSLPFSVDSATRAMTFFNESIGLMSGYSDSTKEEAFFLFGQSLHHVEDMTSPAHIHNDPHLTIYDPEKDDYEGWWLPQQKADALKGVNFELTDYFTGANAVMPVSNPWLDVWGTSLNSLVQTVYNATTYHAVLSYNFSVFEEIANSYGYFTYATIAPDPVGELQEMFPCTTGISGSNCLYWNEDAPDAPAHWTITGVGDFQHQVSVVDENSWWPIEIETNANTVGQEPAPFGNAYYIEQLANGGNVNSPEWEAVKPEKIRASLTNSWVGSMVDNTLTQESLLEKYASTFLAPAVTYGAGFTQYWYDIANTPPFLKSVKVEQVPVVGTTPVVKYAAIWVDQEDADTKRVDSRVFSRTTVQAHIHDEKDLTLTLTFNEPIKQITQLRLGAFNAAGGCALPEQGCVDITDVTNINDAVVKSLMITRA